MKDLTEEQMAEKLIENFIYLATNKEFQIKCAIKASELVIETLGEIEVQPFKEFATYEGIDNKNNYWQKVKTILEKRKDEQH